MSTYRIANADQIEIEAKKWEEDPGDHVTLVDRAHEIVNWVNANGGEARYEELTKAPPEWDVKDRAPRIAVRTINGWAYAKPGEFVVMGDETFPDKRFGGELLDFYPVPDPSQVRHVKIEWKPEWLIDSSRDHPVK